MTDSPMIGVLCGGMSTERDISLKSGHAVADALRSRGHRVVEIDVAPDLPRQLRLNGVDVAWIALHGAFGEDGCVQGLLEVMRIPYTGSAVRGSAIAMDKIATKRLLIGTGIHLPADRVWAPGDAIPTDLGFPVVVKTPGGGSTIGIHIAKDEAALGTALDDCTGFEDDVLIEQFVAGEEITVAVLDGQALPVVSIRPVDGFFDFEAKYTKGRTEYLVPAPIDRIVADTAQHHAEIAFRTIGLAGVARADFIVDESGTPWFLEINTIPGMTAMSLTPMAAGETGMSFEDLVERQLETAQLHVQTAPRADESPTKTGEPPPPKASNGDR
jgi:D-alanine-D-alanine ligase